jgi:hypothetical protein
MGGTGPWAGPPALRRSSFLEVGAGLGELAAGEGEDVTVVVGAGEVGAGDGEEGVVITGVVVCCASTMGGASHAARSANPVAKTAKATIDNLSKACVRSVISPPYISLVFAKKDSAFAHFSPYTLL